MRCSKKQSNGGMDHRSNKRNTNMNTKNLTLTVAVAAANAFTSLTLNAAETIANRPTNS